MNIFRKSLTYITMHITMRGNIETVCLSLKWKCRHTKKALKLKDKKGRKAFRSELLSRHLPLFQVEKHSQNCFGSFQNRSRWNRACRWKNSWKIGIEKKRLQWREIILNNDSTAFNWEKARWCSSSDVRISDVKNSRFIDYLPVHHVHQLQFMIRTVLSANSLQKIHN